MKRKPKWKRSNKYYTLPDNTQLELAEFSMNMNKGMVGLLPEYETCLAGYYGEIWEAGPDSYKVLFTSTIKAREFAAVIGKSTNCTKGDEVLLSFPKSMLYVAVAHLKIPSSPGSRVKLANSFGKRKER